MNQTTIHAIKGGARSLLLASTLMIGAQAAQAAPINSLAITDGSLEIVDTLGIVLASFDLNPGASGTMSMGSYQGSGEIVNDVVVLGLLGATLTSISAYTAPNGGLFSGPYAPPTGSVNGGDLTVDMGSWFADVNLLGIGLSTLHQGGLATGMVTGDDFWMSWEGFEQLSVLLPSGLVSGVARWTLEGTVDVAEVPVPAAFWLFASGLFGLVGITRKRQQKLPA